ncbi:MAG: hypothetical protein ACK5O8_06435, partial [Pirellula sp.]
MLARAHLEIPEADFDRANTCIQSPRWRDCWQIDQVTDLVRGCHQIVEGLQRLTDFREGTNNPGDHRNAGDELPSLDRVSKTHPT